MVERNSDVVENSSDGVQKSSDDVENKAAQTRTFKGGPCPDEVQLASTG